MPQMMPMSWLSLFIMFSATLILFTALNYYMMTLETKMKKYKETPKKALNWKW
uniref:ATP synthase complex subunit 8 n=1 Tax=Cryptotermes sp. 3 AB-2022a TaxID=2942706 RepID=A0A8X8M2L5_9NEOP|nr:ATP synthase F0 subunit 8 [Cryptotermes sp. 3 AB-2022a]